MKVRPVFKIFGALTVVGSLIAGAYYFLFVRSRQPQVELYFDDGSMLAIPGESDEAMPFLESAGRILADNPVEP